MSEPCAPISSRSTALFGLIALVGCGPSGTPLHGSDRGTSSGVSSSSDGTASVGVSHDDGTQETTGAVDSGSSGDTAEPPSEPAVVEGQCATVIEDPILAWEIWKRLELPPGSVISSSTLAELDQLNVPGRGIASLAGLECATGLRGLWLGADDDGSTNAILDLTPIAALPELEMLDASYLPGVDLTMLGTLPKLDWLDISHSDVAALQAVAAVETLEDLWADGNPVSTVDALAANTLLTRVSLADTNIASVVPLAQLPALRRVDVSGTAVTDVAPLATVPTLEVLTISNTAVADVSAFADTNLETIVADSTQIDELPSDLPVRSAYFSNNAIEDLAPLLTWTGPHRVVLQDNLIDDLSSLLDIPWDLGLGTCLLIDLQGNPLGDPSASLTAEQICAQHVVHLMTETALACGHEKCTGPPP